MDKSEITLVFIHQKARFPVAYAAEHAALKGYRVIVLGEPEWVFKGCENLNLADFTQDCDDFRVIYQHVSPNKKNYESFCFERWLVLRNFMRDHDLKNVLYVDSDALVYDGIEAITDIAGGRILDTPYLNFFANVDAVDLVVREMFRVYTTPGLLAERASVGLSGDTYYSDMLLFPKIAVDFPDQAKVWSKTMELQGFDANINRAKVFQAVSEGRRGVKDIKMHDGVPVGTTKEGKKISFRFLHFQGFAKPLMRHFLYGDPSDYSERWWPEINKQEIQAANNKILSEAENTDD